MSRCPRCGNHVRIYSNKFDYHSANPGDPYYCPMSKLRTPITGTTDADYESRAHLIGNLATRIQDEDPHVVWEYLTALPAAELQRMLMVALAAIPVDQSIREMFGWVCELPAAKKAAA
ncbi:hypothetical protein ABFW14_08425 [Mycolicibacterium fortuitum]|uniref:DUF7368 family protein n=1 Tax=Mycolicibacterium fortuitum TaxID=1766 RepID=UPI0034CDC016